MLPEVQQTLLTLEKLRGQVAAIIQATPVDGLNWRPPLPEGADGVNSLAVLAAHLAGAEHFWIAELIGGQSPTRVRAEEFAFVAASADDVLQRLSAVAAESQPILFALTAEQLESSVTYDGHVHPVRGILHHVITHYSLHIGHMQLTYQLWAGGKAFQP